MAAEMASEIQIRAMHKAGQLKGTRSGAVMYGASDARTSNTSSRTPTDKSENEPPLAISMRMPGKQILEQWDVGKTELRFGARHSSTKHSLVARRT
ncbi:hypothetical protein AR689_10920 [Arthrobacter sp. EpRS71]|nr:hypothetical protein AR689_10920 [Arthrobacter sp. EpRS71]